MSARYTKRYEFLLTPPDIVKTPVKGHAIAIKGVSREDQTDILAEMEHVAAENGRARIRRRLAEVRAAEDLANNKGLGEALTQYEGLMRDRPVIDANHVSPDGPKHRRTLYGQFVFKQKPPMTFVGHGENQIGVTLGTHHTVDQVFLWNQTPIMVEISTLPPNANEFHRKLNTVLKARKTAREAGFRLHSKANPQRGEWLAFYWGANRHQTAEALVKLAEHLRPPRRRKGPQGGRSPERFAQALNAGETRTHVGILYHDGETVRLLRVNDVLHRLTQGAITTDRAAQLMHEKYHAF